MDRKALTLVPLAALMIMQHLDVILPCTKCLTVVHSADIIPYNSYSCIMAMVKYTSVTCTTHLHFQEPAISNIYMYAVLVQLALMTIGRSNTSRLRSNATACSRPDKRHTRTSSNRGKQRQKRSCSTTGKLLTSYLSMAH